MSTYYIIMNLGILVYNSSYYKNASCNIGDYIQSLAAINIYRKIIQDFNHTKYEMRKFLELVNTNTVPNFNFVFIKRDNMHDMDQYRGYTNIITIMNGWWLHPYNAAGDISFKIPSNITPIFISFHIANDKLLNKQYIEELKVYQPIGCRDVKTTQKLVSRGIDAYFSGCLTTTIDFFKWKKENDNIYSVDTNVVGNIKLSHASKKWKNIDCKEGLVDALDILEKYSKCRYVNTSRLHCFLPCLGMEVPVNFVAPSGDSKIKNWGSKDRFDGLRELQEDSNKLNKVQTEIQSKTIFEVRKRLFGNVFNTI